MLKQWLYKYGLALWCFCLTESCCSGCLFQAHPVFLHHFSGLTTVAITWWLHKSGAQAEINSSVDYAGLQYLRHTDEATLVEPVAVCS